MMARLLFLIMVMLKFTHSANGQISKQQFAADSIFIYKNFKQHGTTASLWHSHRDLNDANASKVKLSDIDLAEFIDIFKYTPRKRLFQTKYGGDICYFLVYKDGFKKEFILYTAPDYGAIHNLSAMKYWTLQNPQKIERFYKLVNRNWL